MWVTEISVWAQVNEQVFVILKKNGEIKPNIYNKCRLSEHLI